MDVDAFVVDDIKLHVYGVYSVSGVNPVVVVASHRSGADALGQWRRRLAGRQSIPLLSAPPSRRRLSLLDSYTVSIIHSPRAGTAAAAAVRVRRMRRRGLKLSSLAFVAARWH